MEKQPVHSNRPFFGTHNGSFDNPFSNFFFITISRKIFVQLTSVLQNEWLQEQYQSVVMKCTRYPKDLCVYNDEHLSLSRGTTFLGRAVSLEKLSLCPVPSITIQDKNFLAEFGGISITFFLASISNSNACIFIILKAHKFQ